MVCNAFAISITTFVGQNYGAGKIPPHAKKCPRLYGDGIHFGVYCKRSTYSVRKSIYHLFTTDQVVVDIGVHMIRFLIPSYAIYVVIGILSGACVVPEEYWFL